MLERTPSCGQGVQDLTFQFTPKPQGFCSKTLVYKAQLVLPARSGFVHQSSSRDGELQELGDMGGVNWGWWCHPHSSHPVTPVITAEFPEQG